jgi:hypothetical protein
MVSVLWRALHVVAGVGSGVQHHSTAVTHRGGDVAELRSTVNSRCLWPTRVALLSVSEALWDGLADDGPAHTDNLASLLVCLSLALCWMRLVLVSAIRV